MDVKMDKNKILVTRDTTRFRISSFDHKAVDSTIRSIVNIFKLNSAEFSGPIVLPVKRRNTKDPIFVRVMNLFANDDTNFLLKELEKLEVPRTVDISVKNFSPEPAEYKVKDRDVISPARPLKKENLYSEDNKFNREKSGIDYYIRDNGQFGSYPSYEQDT